MAAEAERFPERRMNLCCDTKLGTENYGRYPAAFHTIHAVTNPRRLQAIVRTQFVATSFR